MKKKLFVLAAIFVSVAMSAQSKGEMYIGGAISATFGNQSTEVNNGNGISITTKGEPLESSLDFMAEFGYFVSDNLRFALCLAVPMSSTPTGKSGDTWLKTKTTGFRINPNIAYYMRVADRLYYNPEIGYFFETGSFNEDLTEKTTYKTDYTTNSVYLNFLSFEFRATQKLAIGVGVGSIGYYKMKINDKDSDSYMSSEQFMFVLNKAQINVNYYF